MASMDFDRQWLARLSRSLKSIVGGDIERKVMAGSGEMLSEGTPEASAEWTVQTMMRLDELLTSVQKRDVMTGCACCYPQSDLEDVRQAYRNSGDIDEAIGMLRGKFVSFLRDRLGLGDDLIGQILAAGWGLAGVREDDVIIATKIPKSGSIVDYFRQTDPIRKRRFYCYCPRVRDSIGKGRRISQTYCYCGAGFYKAIWEYILDRPVDVEVLESVLGGGDVCRIAVRP